MYMLYIYIHTHTYIHTLGQLFLAQVLFMVFKVSVSFSDFIYFSPSLFLPHKLYCSCFNFTLKTFYLLLLLTRRLFLRFLL